MFDEFADDQWVPALGSDARLLLWID
jgi:hypothetical protein